MKRFFLNIYNFFFSYPAPGNLIVMWNYGVLAFIFLLVQIVSGLFLSMYYTAHEAFAFVSVEMIIMRDVTLGWFFRYIHSNGASFFFACVYIHLFRSLYYFSYIKPRLIVWNIGVVILLLMIITAFTGYVLPWGQMSFWAATVITNLFSAIPVFGEFIVLWLWGSFSVSTITLNRFFTFHFILPFLLLFFVFLHFIFLHKIGSSNNLLIVKKKDKIKFHPFYSYKDLMVILIVFLIFFSFIWFFPNYLSHPDNYVMADSLSTPAHIVPEWYFLVFYAMLRSIPSKLGGIVVLLLSIIILFLFPFFIKSFFNYNVWKNEKIVNFYSFNIKINFINVKNYFWLKFINFYNFLRTLHLFRINFLYFVFIFVVLSVIGMKPIEYPYLEIGRIFTFLYFFYFFNLVYNFYIKYLIMFFSGDTYLKKLCFSVTNFWIENIWNSFFFSKIKNLLFLFSRKNIQNQIAMIKSFDEAKKKRHKFIYYLGLKYQEEINSYRLIFGYMCIKRHWPHEHAKLMKNNNHKIFVEAIKKC